MKLIQFTNYDYEEGLEPETPKYFYLQEENIYAITEYSDYCLIRLSSDRIIAVTERPKKYGKSRKYVL